MKKIVLILLAASLFLSGLLLTGCTNKKEEEQIELSFIRIGNDAAEADYWKRLINDFNAANPGLLVTYDDAAIGEAMES